MNYFDQIDKIYIINLRTRKDRRDRVMKLLEGLGIEKSKIKIINAVNGKLNYYKDQYNSIINRIKNEKFLDDPKGFETFIKWSFQPGAYGCLISHLKAIEDAKINNYKEILL